MATKKSAPKKGTVKQGPVIQILSATVHRIKDLRARQDDLTGQLAKLKLELEPLEKDTIVALESNVPLEPGCPLCAVDYATKVTPKWKDEAVALAVARGDNPAVYEATIRAKYPPTTYKKLVVNGEAEKILATRASGGGVQAG